MGVEDFKNETIRFRVGDRTYLVRELLRTVSLEDGEGEIEELWLNEAISRVFLEFDNFDLSELSTFWQVFWPLLLFAGRHYRLSVPPQRIKKITYVTFT